ncbi:TPA: amino acid transporter, partial [Legionella pneumophila]|nr:amino acid transporter [Legionella pneumophila]HAU3888631.1 amino acid transporter [Legionella pneumophila]
KIELLSGILMAYIAMKLITSSL